MTILAQMTAIVCDDQQQLNIYHSIDNLYYNVHDNFIIMKKQSKRRQKKHQQKDQQQQAEYIDLMDDSQQAKERRQAQMVQNLNRENIHRYLQNIGRDQNSNQIANKITSSSMNKIQSDLKIGGLIITKNPLPLPTNRKQQKKLSTQQQKQLQFKMKNQLIHKKIQYLESQIKSKTRDRQSQGELQIQFKDILTKQQHQKRVKEIVEQKLARKKRIEQLLIEQKRRLKEEQLKREELKKLEEQKVRQLKRFQIEQKIKRRKQQHQKFVQFGSKLHQDYTQIKNKTRLYQQMEQKYQSEMMLPILQERKNKLKEIRDFHLRFSVEEIKQHQKQYLKKSKEKLLAKKQTSPSSQWKYLPPPRSERLSKMLQNQQLQIKEKLQERKKKNQQKSKRQQLYKIELKQKYIPRIDAQKRSQIQRRYFQQQKKKERIHSMIDRNRIGQAYLQMAKKMKRHESARNEQFADEALIQPELKESAARVQKSNEYYEQMRRKKIQHIVNSQKDSLQDKFLMLQRQSDKLIQKIKQKQQISRIQNNESARDQATELILTSIQAKMGIISLLKEQQEQS